MYVGDIWAIQRNRSPYTRQSRGNRNCIWGDPDVGVSKDFKATIINMFKYLKKIILKELKECVMTMSHQIQYQQRDRNYKSKNIEILELKRIIIRNENFTRGAQQIWAGRRISTPEDKLKEIMQSVKHREKRKKKKQWNLRERWDTINHTHICIWEYQKKKRKKYLYIDKNWESVASRPISQEILREII